MLKHLAREMQNSGIAAEISNSLGMVSGSGNGLNSQTSSVVSDLNIGGVSTVHSQSGQIPLQRQQQPSTGPLSPPPYQSAGAQQLPDFVPTGIDGHQIQRGPANVNSIHNQQQIHHSGQVQNSYHNVKVNTNAGQQEIGHSIKMSLSHPDLSRLQAIEAAANAAGVHQQPQAHLATPVGGGKSPMNFLPAGYSPSGNIPVNNNYTSASDMLNQSFVGGQSQIPSQQQQLVYQESRYPSRYTTLIC